MASSKSHHFVLVHGLGQGAWSWFKLKILLESAGHKVSAVDLAGSGTNLGHIDEVDSMLEYSEPLLELMGRICNEEKVVIVGHSLGGMNIAYAMDKFPNKVAIGVFLSAFMPDTVNPPSYVLNKYLEIVPEGMFMDTKITCVENGPGKPKTTMHFGPNFQACSFYKLSPPEDCTLGITLTRVGAMFTEELSTAPKFSNEGYGSVSRAYIVAKQDEGLLVAHQRWMIENNPVQELREIEGADHFSMNSKPQEICSIVLLIPPDNYLESSLSKTGFSQNLTYGKDNPTLEEIRAAAELANAAVFIDKLPQGLETMVGDYGIQLSGEQKQIVAIARAILRDPRILLLDEATSALDAESERIVQKALDRIMTN